MPIYHDLVASSGLSYCASVFQSPIDLELRFQLSVPGHAFQDCPLENEASRSELCWPFEPMPSEETVRKAVTHVVQLDAMEAERFRSGQMCEKAVPVAGRSSVARQLPESASDYRNERASVGQMIRPLFLSRPDFTSLRIFQMTGVDWLIKNPRSILADDMGLGKTVQAASALRVLFRLGEVASALVVCPRSLIANWEVELVKWAPELTQLRMTPSSRVKNSAWQDVVGRIHVLITNYEQLTGVPPIVRSFNFDVVIADEAHRIRNLSAGVTRAIRELKATRFWALTGTPIERDHRDLVTILSTVAPYQFSVSESKRQSLTSLRARSRPYILRRLKRDVLSELPPFLEVNETIDLSQPQLRSYRAVLKKHSLEGHRNPLAMINELRTICDYEETTGSSSKAIRICELLESIHAKGEKAVVFSYLLRPLDLLRTLVTEKFGTGSCVEFRGDQPVEERQASLSSFQHDSEVILLLGSSRVAGEGITLTAANNAIFFNRWWNPSFNAQARDRILRIGQSRNVNIYSFTCRDTIEEVLNDILENKTDISLEVIDRLAQSELVQDSPPYIVQEISSRLLSTTS